MANRFAISLLVMGLAASACSGDDDSATVHKNDAVAGSGQSKSDSGVDVKEGTPSSTDTKVCEGKSLATADFDALFEVDKALEPGEETEVCVLQQVGDQDIWMNSSDLVLSHGSHHGLLWLTAYDALPATDSVGDPVELGKLMTCQSGANGRFRVTQPIAGSQGLINVTGPGVMPDNVAIKVPAHSYVALDLHMLNATDKPLAACMLVGLKGIPESQVEQNAGILYYYNPFITVPAKSSATARMACPITQDIQLKSGVSHMHKAAVGYKAEWLDGDPFDAKTKSVMTLYETTNWNDPQDTIYSEPLALKAGHYIDYRCDYQNPGDTNVAQGLETTDEMCQFIGIYWPYDTTLALCGANIDSVGAIGYEIGDGKGTGADFLSCFWGTDFSGGATDSCGTSNCRDYAARYKWQSCFTDSCESVSRYTRSFSNCVGEKAEGCSAECPDDTSGLCSYMCLQTACADAITTLQNAKCE